MDLSASSGIMNNQIDIFSLTRYDLISIMDKMSPVSFARLRRTYKTMDEFAESNRRHIGAYHDRKIFFKGYLRSMYTYVFDADGCRRHLRDPYRSISGFSFRGVLLKLSYEKEKQKEIFEILKTTKKRFLRLDFGHCQRAADCEEIARFIRPKILHCVTLCHGSMYSIEAFCDILESVNFLRHTRRCGLPDVYEVAIKFRLVHLVSKWQILPDFLKAWRYSSEPSKLEWLKIEDHRQFEIYSTQQKIQKLIKELMAGMQYNLEFSKNLKFLDFGKERPTVCISIPRKDGKMALLAISIRLPVNIQLCKKVLCIDFLPCFEGDFQSFSVRNDYFPSMWTGYNLACRKIWPELYEDFAS